MITRTTSPHDYHFMLIAQITRTTSQLFRLNVPKPLSLEIGASGNSRDGEAAQGRLMRLPIQTLQGSGRNIVERISDICKPEMAYTLDELTQVLYPASPRRGQMKIRPGSVLRRSDLKRSYLLISVNHHFLLRAAERLGEVLTQAQSQHAQLLYI